MEFSETSTTRASDEDLWPANLASGRPKKRAGRKKFRETRHPVYRGVRLRNAGKWVCELREPSAQRRVWLGTYPTPEMAARAHDVAALALRGRAACLNFADSAWRLPVPASKDAAELRRAAAEAAEAFRPTEATGEEVAVNGEEGDDLEAGSKGGLVLPELYGFGCESLNVATLAEGVLLSPPPFLGWQFGWDVDEVESDAEMELWSF